MEYPLIIEFAGIAGCGKTTRALKTVSALRKKGFNVWSRMEQNRFSISFIKTFFLRPLRSLIFINDKKRKSILTAWEDAGGTAKPDNLILETKWWAWMDLWRMFQANLENKYHAAVFDEGMMQHLISACRGKSITTENFLKFAESYVKYANKYTAVIIETSPETCMKRLMERKKLPKRMHELSKEEIIKRLQNDNALLKMIHHSLRSTGTDVVAVEGMDIEKDTEIITAEIVRKLKK